MWEVGREECRDLVSFHHGAQALGGAGWSTADVTSLQPLRGALGEQLPRMWTKFRGGKDEL